jgi:dolichol-phosphate mannosyltransferase
MKKKITLTIIIPVYNEEDTIRAVLKKVHDVAIVPWEKEILIVDDGSTDKTVELLRKNLSAFPHSRLIVHDVNKGKGAAVQTGMNEATGEYILIQDADLEYDPADIPKLIKPIQEDKTRVVFGTRLDRLPNFRKEERTFRFLLHYLGNRALSFLVSLLYHQHITDMETGYKVFPREAIQKMSLRSTGFEFEPEITINLIKMGFHIREVPISTNPRGYEKGKKLQTLPDGFKALVMILRHLS